MRNITLLRNGLSAVVSLLLLDGCATVKPEADYARTRAIIQETTGAADSFNPEETAITQEQVEEMLHDGLALDEAVRIALLNNRDLQAAFMHIGVAKADCVQSGLFSNPTLGFALLLPEGGGLGNAQLNLAQNIADLWQIPVRRMAAASRLEEAVLRIARIAGERAADVKRAYYRAVAANELADAAVQNMELLSKSHETVRTQQEAGTARLLDVNLARGEMLRAELALRDARLAEANARRELGKLLSLSSAPDEIRLVDPLPAATPLPAGPDELIALARDKRLDLRSLAQAADAAEQELRLEYAQVFPDVTVGVALEQNERRALPGRDVAADFARGSIAAGAPTVPDIQSRGERNGARRSRPSWDRRSP